jgi:hypothetical protein
MNSDLVYKKKYLKYKSKYTALQQQQQQQGAGLVDLMSGKGKYGWYLFVTTNDGYRQLFDRDLGFPVDGITLDKTNKICELLCRIAPESFYIERSINILNNESKIVKCSDNSYTKTSPQFFYKSHVDRLSISFYVSALKTNGKVGNNTHWFIVDFDPSGNRISTVFPI